MSASTNPPSILLERRHILSHEWIIRPYNGPRMEHIIRQITTTHYKSIKHDASAVDWPVDPVGAFGKGQTGHTYCGSWWIHGLLWIVCILFWLVVDLPLWKILVSWGWLFPKCGKIKHVPNHQPVLFDYFKIYFSHHLDSHGLSSNHFKHNKQQITAIAPSNGQRKNEEQRSLQLGHLKLNQLL